MQVIYPIGSWHGFVAGQHVKMLIETKGATADDEEVTYPPGTRAKIEAVANFGERQGAGVHMTVGDGDRAICNTFDDMDVAKLGRVPFVRI